MYLVIKQTPQAQPPTTGVLAIYIQKIQDIMFLIKCLKKPSDNFNILDDVSFSSNPTSLPLPIKFDTNSVEQISSSFYHFYFTRITKLWNSLYTSCRSITPVQLLKIKLYQFMWNRFVNYFNSNISHTSFVPVPTVS